MTDLPTVLLVEDDVQQRQMLSDFLAAQRYEVHAFESARRALEHLLENGAQIVISDITMPDMEGVEFLKAIRAHDPLVEVILVTADYSIEEAVKLIRLGAYNYLRRPLDYQKLRQSLDEILDHRDLRQQTGLLQQQLKRAYRFQGMVACNPRMLEVFHLVRRLARHGTTVLVTGETGTGKEMVARALHDLGPHAEGQFVPCNCGAIPAELMESELFGHVRGAFSGAVRDKPGLFELADGGTLFLDEIGELPLPMQVKLLRVLATGEVHRVGADRDRTVNTHVIAATNRDLQEMVAEGTFREDLFYRIAVAEIRLPPLRERTDDIPLLWAHLLDELNRKFNRGVRGLSRQAQIKLLHHHWPGNVRELANVLERAYLLTDRGFIRAQDLEGLARPSALPTAGRTVPPDPQDGEDLTLEAAERAHIHKVFRKNRGNKLETARALGISRSTLYQKLRRYSIAAG